jgi:hypothetical protein
MRAAAPVKAHTADLVNVALEELVRQKERLEMLAFSTLDRMASRIRSEVEASQCQAIVARMSDAARERVVGMLEVVVLSVGEMKDISEPRRTSMTVCLLAQVQAVVRDETVVMLSKRMSRHLKRAQEELLEIERRQKETTEHLLATFRDVLTALRGSGEAAVGAGERAASLDDLLALKNARAAIEGAGGFEAQLAEL